MFKSKPKIDVSATDTLIGEGSVFEGKIKSEASLRIEGHMIGDIECSGDVTIGENGKAKSNISARNVVIAGTVHGNVMTKGTLTLTATAQLHGNVSSKSLIISEGAVFQGSSKMGGKSESSTSGSERSESASNTNANHNSIGSPYPQTGYGPAV